jgi:uncharacterized phage protein gp47/JayE
MTFLKSFDEILAGLITDYRNQFPEADTSQGSLLFIKSACMASALWGLYHYQEYISQQIFPDTADTEALEHHSWVRELSRTYEETDAALLARLLEHLRRPPAGGNKYDYVKWAMSIDNVAAAYCIPLYLGLGTVGVVVMANAETTGSEIPDQALLDAVYSHIDSVRPVGMNDTLAVSVLAPTVVSQAVSMTVTGDDANATVIASDVTDYMSQMKPGQTLHRAKLTGIAIAAGAGNVVLSAPAADVLAASNEIIRPGVINVAKS